MGMKRTGVVVGALLSLLPLIGMGVTALRQHSSHGRVYSAAVVGAGHSHDPAAWVNRTLLVRGVAVTNACTLPPDVALCGIPRPSLRDPDPGAARDRLDLSWGPGDPLLTVLRRVPFVGAILPGPHVIRWEAVDVYRVHLRIERPCGGACYEAVLLDAAP